MGNITTIDWVIIGLYITFMLGVGLWLKKRAEQNVDEFFVGGRDIPWWLAGISMVATTFAADTPLAVTGIVASNGIAGNWIWWNFMMSGMVTVFMYAKLWHRAGVVTDVEFIEIRYSGKPAQFLRGFRALYLAFPINIIILGWVTLGMSKVLEVITGASQLEVIIILFVFTTIYIVVSGLWGVVVTDFIQFFIAMTGSIIFMMYAVDEVQGIQGLKDGLMNAFGEGHHYLDFSPLTNPSIVISTVLVWIGMQWWASWYPGAEPGGGGYIAQRMFATRTDKDATKATLFFNIAHYALRPWPWIIVALAVLVVYPETQLKATGNGEIISSSSTEMIIQYENGDQQIINASNVLQEDGAEWTIQPNSGKVSKNSLLFDAERGYPMLMKQLLPKGIFGLLLVAFLSAFMSTVSTHLNWGASYVVNDFYKRFIKPESAFSDVLSANKHYVLISRIATVIMAITAIIVSMMFQSVKGGWEIILSLGAGTGLVYLLRWYWWRINAWSEISAMATAFVASLSAGWFGFNGFAEKMIFTTLVTTIVWIIVTFITAPENTEILRKFYEKVQPAGPGWKKISKEKGISLLPDIINVILGIMIILSFLFGIGAMIFYSLIIGFVVVLTGIILFIILSNRFA
jgi:solute:Na+ symporter, SSS family